MRTIIAVLAALLLGAFLGGHFFAVPLRAFSVDREGNQHCSGLRHGESFEVFCLSTERPLGESMNRNVDRRLYPPRRRVPSAEDYRAPWQAPRPPVDRNPQGFTYRTPEERE
jgi:hypothetical protein